MGVVTPAHLITDMRALPARLHDRLDALRRVVRDPGTDPAKHYALLRRHEREWPALWEAITGLIGPALTVTPPAIDPVPAHSGRAHTVDELTKVADVYQHARVMGRPVQRAVATALGVPLSTATKRIMAARHAGLIP